MTRGSRSPRTACLSSHIAHCSLHWILSAFGLQDDNAILSRLTSLHFHPQQSDFGNGVVVVVRFVNVVQIESEFGCFYGLDVRVLHPLDVFKAEALLEPVLGLYGNRAGLLEYAEAVSECVIDGFLITYCDADIHD